MTNNTMPVAVSLFDESGNMLRPWAEAGYECHMFDLLDAGQEEREERVGKGVLIWHRANLDDPKWHRYIVGLKPVFAAAFAPCDDMAVSGSKHFAGKLAKDPDCQNVAVARARLVESLADEIGCPWMSENPVSVLASKWRKPNHYFHPCEYGGFLPVDDVHPRWPDYIAPRDAYTKKTCIWSGNGFVMPDKRPVPPVVAEVRLKDGSISRSSTQFKRLGGKSKKTKQIRSETARGFALATFDANGRVK